MPRKRPPLTWIDCPGTHDGRTCGQQHDARKCKRHVDEEDGTLRPCGNFPRRNSGLEVCDYHGGRTPNALRGAEQRLAAKRIEDARLSLGVPIDVSPTEAMLDLIREAAGNVVFYRARIQHLDQLVGPAPPLPPLASDDTTAPAAELHAAIAGRVDPANWKAERHVLVRMYDDERDKLARWCKDARQMGVEEHRLELEQERGRQLAAVIEGTLTALLATLLGLRSVFAEREIADVYERAVREVWSREVPQIVTTQVGQVRGVQPSS